MDNSIYQIFKGKNVLITGHTGFKGAWLAIWLNELGANVIGYALDPSSEKDVYNLSKIKSDIVDIRGDIRDSDKLDKIFKKWKPEIVFHLAAQSLVRYSYEKPKYTYEVNLMGTMNVLESIRSTDESKVGIIVTSDKCYENKEWVWGYRENEPMGGHDPYSSSKACCELLVSSFRNSYFNVNRYEEHHKAIATVRAGNVIGGGDWSLDRIIPDCIRAFESNKDIVVRNPNSKRPWQHVLDPLSGYLLLASKILTNGVGFSEAWNFGPKSDRIISVEDIVNKVIQLWGAGNRISLDSNHTTMHEANSLSLDISKAKHELNWYPKWDTDTTLEKTVEWYKNYKNTPVYDLCIKQINEHCSI
jgi:CDP-glucose 4,6-dehydratase